MRFVTVLLSVVVLSIASCGPQTPVAGSPPPTAGDGWIEGKLLDGIVAIGAETTGWAIEQPASDGVSRVEVDCAKVEKAAAALAGKRVRATGGWEERTYVERGMVRVFVVEEIVAAP